MALADTVSAQEILSNFSDDIERVRYQKDRVKASELPQGTKPMSDGGLGSPYQILSLLQADLLLVKNRMREPGPASPPMRAALERSGGYPVGATGMSIDVYVGIANWMVEDQRARLSYSFETVLKELRTLYAVRSKNILVAMKDTYNWRKLLSPTELLDLDSLILMCLAIGDEHLEHQLDEFLCEESPLCQAPLIIARELSRNRRTITE